MSQINFGITFQSFIKVEANIVGYSPKTRSCISIGYQQIIELKMISGTFLVLLTAGFLSVVMALPSYYPYQNEADKQGYRTYYQGMLHSRFYVDAVQIILC